MPLFLIFTFTLKMEIHTRLFDKRDNFGFDIVRMPFYCSKMFYGSIGAEFLRVTCKIEDLSLNCEQLLSRMLNQNGQMKENQIFLNKNGPTTPRRFY